MKKLFTLLILCSTFSFGQYIKEATLTLKDGKSIEARDVVYLGKIYQFTELDNPYTLESVPVKHVTEIKFDSINFSKDIPKLKETYFENYTDVFFYYGNTGLAKKNGKYGLINRKGDSLTQFKYTMVRNYGFNHYICQTESKKSHILNSDGKIIFNKDLKFDIKSHYFDKDSILIYQEKIDKKKLNGLVNINGKSIIEAKYEEIYFINDNQLYAVKSENKYGFINKFGKEVIPIIYDEVSFNINENLIPVKKNGKWGFVNRKNETKIPFEYDEANSFLNGIAFVKKGEYYGCIDTKNKVKIKFILSKTNYQFFTENLALFVENGKYGFINKKGKIKIPAIYNKAFPFINGLAYVELDGKVGYINKTGNEIIPIKYKQLWFENDGVIRFAE